MSRRPLNLRMALKFIVGLIDLRTNTKAQTENDLAALDSCLDEPLPLEELPEPEMPVSTFVGEPLFTLSAALALAIAESYKLEAALMSRELTVVFSEEEDVATFRAQMESLQRVRADRIDIMAWLERETLR